VSPWELDAIVLCQVTRYFQAARRASATLDDKQLESLVGFAGNMLWAHSAFSGVDKPQERAMAVLGGAAGTVAGGLDLGGGARREAAEAALDELEVDLLGRIDAILELLLGELRDNGLDGAGPATVNAWVWNRLFPGYPWPCGQRELERAIRARLT
jgi:hypothetical protein